MTDLALVTGASSGIGREFARLHAARGGDLIVTARRAGALDALKAELEAAHGVRVDAVACDLGTAEGVEGVVAACAGREVGVLINNAGFGGHGPFVERPLIDDLTMIDLNVKSLVALCHHLGREMAARGRGRILNVGSTAGMMPGPLQATYFATKAFVESFSLALHEELRGRGVSVTVLAPGYVRTGFAERADLQGTGLTAQKGADAASVARVGYDAMMAGRPHVINERGLSVMLNWVVPFLPRRTVLGMVRRMQEKRAG
jgi:short-subunit dehydrogenase